MSRLKSKINNQLRRANRVRATVQGTSERPRLSVTITNLHVSAQIIDDSTHTTLVGVTTVGQKDAKGTMTERAAWVGAQIAKKAKAKKIKKVAFFRKEHRMGNFTHRFDKTAYGINRVVCIGCDQQTLIGKIWRCFNQELNRPFKSFKCS